jgi:alpha-glucosidase
MQWTAGAHAGFSSNVHTWLPLGADYKSVNVAAESADPGSLLNWHEQLIQLRRSNRTLHDGGVVMLDSANPAVLSYLRTAPEGAKPILISLNMSGELQHLESSFPPMRRWSPRSNHSLSRRSHNSRIAICHEHRICRLQSA